MRLLYFGGHGEINRTNDETKRIPCYAILSHTWGPDHEEVSFGDLTDAGQSDKAGYRKIHFCGEQAKKDGLQYFWVDTCCINKASLSELAEAIASMFRWYVNASKCYVYMSDVSVSCSADSNAQFVWESDFRKSRWFTRGWTLQELLAPRTVEFYSKEGHLLGSKKSLETLIHEITGIPVSALRGNPLTEFSIEDRLSWAKNRETTRKEDKAYCLQGIFGVFLPLIYGEEDHAFIRLTKAIQEHHETRDLESIDQEYRRKRRKTGTNESNVPDTYPKITVREALDILRFDQIDDRLANITSWQTRTCQWLLESKAYLEWTNPTMFSEHGGFFWIKGKPGCGKSTLTKFMLQALQKDFPDTIFLSFFFNARGTQLERSIEGLYRSLIVQILGKQFMYSDLWEKHFPSAQPLNDHFLSTPSRLKQLLYQAVRLVRAHKRLTIIVDALDEGNDSEVRDMILFFEELGEDVTTSRKPLHILLSSRYYPHITVRRAVELKVEEQRGHATDIETYVSNQLRIGESKETRAIQEIIQKRALGVFIWVVLVVHILNKAYDRGLVYSLRKKLEEIPDNLHELFKSILSRDKENMDQTQLCLQWILFAHRPLREEELYFAIFSGFEPSALHDWDPEVITRETMGRFILSSSKGLAEVTTTKDRIVQFIHESVRDFLLKDGGLSDLMSCSNAKLRGLVHNQLKECCEVYFRSDIFDELPQIASLLEGPSLGSRKTVTKRFPFLEYSIRHVLFHANVSQAAGLDQERFLDRFPLNRWARLNNTLAQSDLQHHPRDVSLLYILAAGNYSHLLRLVVRDELDQRETNGCHGNPIFAAVACGSQEAFDELMAAEKERFPQGCAFPYRNSNPLLFLGLHAASNLAGRCLAFYDFGNNESNRRTKEWCLTAMAHHGNNEGVASLISNGVNVNALGTHGNVLSAARKGQKIWSSRRDDFDLTIQLLLDAGAEELRPKESPRISPTRWDVLHEELSLVLPTRWPERYPEESPPVLPTQWQEPRPIERLPQALMWDPVEKRKSYHNLL